MKKKALALALMLALCLSLLPSAAFAAGDFVIENGVLTKYTGSGGDVVIPDGVTGIGEGAFESCDGLTSIIIPDSVTVIENTAFSWCTSLTSVSIPNHVTEIGAWAFGDCKKLTSVSIPSSVKKIGLRAFDQTVWLRNQGDLVVVNGILLVYQGKDRVVTIPSGVTRIGDGAFYGYWCKDIKNITIPDSVTEIGSDAFFGCESLTGVNIPDGVTEIGSDAFNGCKSLTSITIPDCVTEIGFGAFNGCKNLTSVTIPDGVPTIGMEAFKGCTSLTSVTIPDSVTEIHSQAFMECGSLTDVYYGGNKTQWNAILIVPYENSNLLNAKIHYNSNGTGTENPPTPAIPSTGTAYTSAQNVGVDNRTVKFPCYALKDEKGYSTNYMMLRDVAHVLRGTGAQFSVGWDGPTSTITATSGGVYQDVGSEMNTPFSGNRTYTVSASKLMVNGKAVDVTAILLKDDKGGGYTYFKLRDLGQALNFNVSWSAEKGIYINTDQPYSDAN